MDINLNMENEALFFSGLVLGLLLSLATNFFTNAFFNSFPLEKKLYRIVTILFGVIIFIAYTFCLFKIMTLS